MSNAGHARFDVGLNDSEFSRGLRDLERRTDSSLQRVGQRWQTLGRDVSRVGRGFTLGVTLPIVGAGAAILKTAGDFERALNRVAALTGATGASFERLKQQAQDLGATTQFSASQAADAMGFLAQAGFEADEIYSSLPDTLKLAGAAQLDLGRAADIVSNILTGFQLPVSELNRAVDVLTKTFTSANTDLNQLGEGFKFVGPVATSVGQEFEETAALLGLLSNAGLQASQAGTGLRQVLIGMSQEQEIFGISTRDATGQLRPFSEFLEEAERRGVSLEEAIDAFSVRGGPAFLAVLGQGSDALKDLTDDLRNAAGTADEIQAVQLQGLNGKLLELRSAAEGLAIAFGESGLLGAATDLVQKITEQIRRFSELDDGTKRLITTTALLLAGVGPLLTITGKLITATGFLITNFGRIVTVGRLLGGPLGILAGAAAGYKILNDALDAGRQSREAAQASFEAMILRMQEYRNELAVTSEAERNAAVEALNRQRRVLEITLQNQEAFFNAVLADVVAFADKGFFGQLFSFGAANVDLQLLDQLEGQIASLRREISGIDSEIERVTNLTFEPRPGLVDLDEIGLGELGLPELDPGQIDTGAFEDSVLETVQDVFDRLGALGAQSIRRTTRLIDAGADEAEALIRDSQTRIALLTAAQDTLLEDFYDEVTDAQLAYLQRRIIEEEARLAELQRKQDLGITPDITFDMGLEQTSDAVVQRILAEYGMLDSVVAANLAAAQGQQGRAAAPTEAELEAFRQEQQEVLDYQEWLDTTLREAGELGDALRRWTRAQGMDLVGPGGFGQLTEGQGFVAAPSDEELQAFRDQQQAVLDYEAWLAETLEGADRLGRDLRMGASATTMRLQGMASFGQLTAGQGFLEPPSDAEIEEFRAQQQAVLDYQDWLQETLTGAADLGASLRRQTAAEGLRMQGMGALGRLTAGQGFVERPSDEDTEEFRRLQQEVLDHQEWLQRTLEEAEELGRELRSARSAEGLRLIGMEGLGALTAMQGFVSPPDEADLEAFRQQQQDVLDHQQWLTEVLEAADQLAADLERERTTATARFLRESDPNAMARLAAQQGNRLGLASEEDVEAFRADLAAIEARREQVAAWEAASERLTIALQQQQARLDPANIQRLAAQQGGPALDRARNAEALANAENVLEEARARVLQITGEAPTPIELLRAEIEQLIQSTPLASEGLKALARDLDDFAEATERARRDREVAQGFFTTPSQQRARDLGVTDEQFNQLVEAGVDVVEGFAPIVRETADDFSETIARAGVRFASDIAQAFMDGDPSRAVTGLASFGSTIAQTLLPGIKGVLVGGAIDIFGQVLGGLMGRRQAEERERALEERRSRSLPSLRIQINVQQNNNYGTSNVDPRVRADNDRRTREIVMAALEEVGYPDLRERVVSPR